MSSYKSISTYVDVDVELSEWSTEELLEEIRSREDESFEGEESALHTICDKNNDCYRREREAHFDFLNQKSGARNW